MSTMTATRVAIHLEAACYNADCTDLAFRFKKQLGVEHYSRGAAILEMPDSLQAWRDEHRTARKRADRSARLGYEFAEIDRSQFSDDIHEINVSLRERQGRPMTPGYTTYRPQGSLPDYPCDRHRIHTYGILQGERLRAYLTLYRVGELGMVSMILGHGDHLGNDIMYLLVYRTIGMQIEQGGTLYYNLWNSGTDGLRYFKERVGFVPVDLEWVL